MTSQHDASAVRACNSRGAFHNRCSSADILRYHIFSLSPPHHPLLDTFARHDKKVLDSRFTEARPSTAATKKLKKQSSHLFSFSAWLNCSDTPEPPKKEENKQSQFVHANLQKELFWLHGELNFVFNNECQNIVVACDTTPIRSGTSCTCKLCVLNLLRSLQSFCSRS